MAPARSRCAPNAVRVRVVPSAIPSAVASVRSGPATRRPRANPVPRHARSRAPTHVRILVPVMPGIRAPIPVRRRALGFGPIPDPSIVRIRGGPVLIVAINRIADTNPIAGTSPTVDISLIVPAVPMLTRVRRVGRPFVPTRVQVVDPPDRVRPTGAPAVPRPASWPVVILSPRRIPNLPRTTSRRRRRSSVRRGLRVPASRSRFTSASSSASPWASRLPLLRACLVRHSAARKVTPTRSKLRRQRPVPIVPRQPRARRSPPRAARSRPARIPSRPAPCARP